ncbi:hypothetical protein [Streptomyces zhihengii]|uniref:Uncharacterized protein n=1 Tax=Streptomyces zhihengii TaxID=1818004 RepID=A0ABS2UQ79_9ACTN|nr:hypothetical protein [Streptomyces zhihengii]MBM9619553.1 hypothetical protein [Streptomyces zhihengii]
MSQQDELTAMRQHVDELTRRVGRLEQALEAALRGAAPAPPGTPKPPAPVDLVTIPDTPYDSTLWTDSDDEGLGARDRHAP